MDQNTIITDFVDNSKDLNPTLQQTLRVVKADLIDGEYTVRVGSESIRNNTGVRFNLGDGLGSAPQLTDTITTECWANLPRPRSWTDGIIGVRWYLTGDTSSTNTIKLRNSLFCFGAADQIGTIGAGELSYTYGYDMVTYTTLAGPAAHWKRVTFESNVVDYSLIDQSIERIYARILRDGTDNYNGQVYVMGLELVYFPKRTQS